MRQTKSLDRVKIDHSRAKIENKNINDKHGDAVEGICLEHFRKKADLKHELQQAKEEAEYWRRMRQELHRNRRHSALQEYMEYRQDIDPSYTVIGPQGEVRRSGKAFQRSVSLQPMMNRRSSSGDDKSEDDEDRNPSPGRRILRSKFSFSKLECYDSDDEKSNRFRPVPPKTVSRSISAKSTKSTSKKPQRSKSASAAPRTESSFSRATVSFRHEDEPSVVGQPGRSFKDLRELTSVDRLAENERLRRRAERQRRRQQLQDEEKRRLESKIKTFYVDLEQFKRKLTPKPFDVDQYDEPLAIYS